MLLPPNGDVKQKNFPVIHSLRHPLSESLLDDSDTDLCGSDSESEFSDQELEQRDHWEDEDCIENTLSEPRLNAFTQSKYKEGADSRLRGLYGKGSASTNKRKARELRQRAEIASKCYSIVDMLRNPPSERSRAANPFMISDEERAETLRKRLRTFFVSKRR
jgi:hypothetical protein